MTSLSELLADPEEPIEFVLYLDTRDPVTDDEVSYGYGTVGVPQSYGVPRFLSHPGVRRVQAEADDHLSTLVAAPGGEYRLVNTPAGAGEPGRLDFLRSLSLAGRMATLKAGSPLEPLASYEVMARGRMLGEPEFTGQEVIIRTAAALRRLDVDVEVGAYVGEPGAVHVITSASSNASSPDRAAHHLTSFWLAGRVLVETLSSGVIRHTFARFIGGAVNWQCGVMGSDQGPSAGAFRARYSVGGFINAVNLRSSGGLVNDGEPHWWVFSRGDDHAYLMVDGVVIDELSSPPTPDFDFAAGVVHISEGNVCWDHRIVDHYIAPEAARALMAVRGEDDVQGLVGLWRGDDRTGNTLTDYSAQAAHATFAGVEGVGFEHVGTGQGYQGLAGRSMPAFTGAVRNAPADLVDPELEIVRINDRVVWPWETPALGSTMVRDQGQELDSTTDYDMVDGEPLIAMTGEPGEPVSATLVYSPFEPPGLGLVLGSLTPGTGAPMGSLLVDRGPLEANDLDLHRLHSVYPHTVGVAFRRQRLDSLLQEILAGVGGYAFPLLDGRLAADAFLPPTAPGPRGGRCVEIASSPEMVSGISWGFGPVAGGAKNFTIAGWFKLHRAHAADEPFGDVLLAAIADGPFGAGGTEVRWTMDADGGSSVMQLELYTNFAKRDEQVSRFLVDDPLGEWVFMAVTNDYDQNRTAFYAGPLGGSVRLVGFDSGLGFDPWVFPDPSWSSVAVGGDSTYPFFRGGVAEPAVWQGVLTLANLQAVMDGTPPSAPAFTATLAGDSAPALADAIGGGAGTVTGDVAGRPDLEVDLRKTPMEYGSRQLTPASRIEVRYDRNWSPLQVDQIAAAVPEAEHGELTLPARAILYDDPDIAADYLEAKEVVYSSHWATLIGARATMRLARYRHAPGRTVATLKHVGGQPVSAFERLATILDLGSEILVRGDQEELSGDDGAAFRVVGVTADHSELTVQLGLAR